MITVENQIKFTRWAKTLITTSLAMSLTVNALVTGLIVLKIVKLFREVTNITRSRSTLQRVIGVIIESGIALFAIQFARLVTTFKMMILMDQHIYSAFILTIFIHQMLNVIIKSVIVTELITDNIGLG